MLLAKIEDGNIVKYPYTFVELKADNPNTTFPVDLEGCDLSDFGVVLVKETTPPIIDEATKNLVEAEPKLIKKVWTQAWSTVDASEEEIAERLAAKWASIRADRNARLAECDWTQLSDTTVDKEAWKTYRQALRDITTQETPFAIVWPDKP